MGGAGGGSRPSSGPGSDGGQSRSVRRYIDLAILGAVPVGTEIWVEEAGRTLFSAGDTTAAIAKSIRWVGWTEQTVWIDETSLRYFQQHHGVLSDPVAVVAAILNDPASVHLDSRIEDAVLFVADSARLERHGLLTSQSIRYVDLVVEFRQVAGGKYARIAHLAPTDQVGGMVQIWP